ncbi:MAG: hypothetical protein D6707_04425, partial [Bacteroidetes bacterium]
MSRDNYGNIVSLRNKQSGSICHGVDYLDISNITYSGFRRIVHVFTSFFKRKKIGLNEYQTIIKNWKKQGNKIVFTNGCFDILHKGHVDYLREAKKLGDKLIVGLNSDISVRKLNKGKARPLQDE